MAHGGPAGPEDLEAFYSRIRRGRTPAEHLLKALAARYEAIGWSPLNELTRRQADGLQARLETIEPNRWRVYMGLRYAAPFIGDVVRRMADEGIAEGVGVVMAPHYSRMITGTYISHAEEVRQALPRPFRMAYVERWGEHPAFLDAVADRLTAALAKLPEEIRAETPVVFSAHSLPERILSWGDPYPEELRRTAAGVAGRVGVRRWRFAYQSAGRTAEPWLGPDVRDEVRCLHAAAYQSVALCPIGFVADNLEVLYDLDIEVGSLCARLGIRFVRAGSLNEHPRLLDALADLVQCHAITTPDEFPARH